MRASLACLFGIAALWGLAVPARAAEQQSFAAALTYATPALVAAQGDTLRFTNLDLLAQHDLDSDQAGLFASDLIFGGDSTTVNGVESLQPGTYTFHCSIHSWMKGALTVTGGDLPEAPALPGLPPPPDPGSGPPNPVDLLPRVAAEPLGPGEWPSYGHDLSNTRDGGDAGPELTEVPTLGPVWSHASTDGDFTGTPVVAGGKLVAGASGGTVFALDAASGEQLWSHDFDKPINASAAIAGGRVYIPLVEPGSPSVAALDLDTGAVLWETVTTDQPTADSYGSPTVWNGRVFIGTSGYFGEQVSEVDVQARGSVVALDAATGDKLWQTFTVPPGHDGGAVWSTPAVDTETGRLYVGTGNAYHDPVGPMTDSMLAMDPESGAILDHFQAVEGDAWNGVEDWPENPDADFGASPNLFTGPDGQTLVGQGEKNGMYWALDRATMEPEWNTLTGPGSFTGGIIGSTAFDGERIYGTNTLTAEVVSLDRAGGLAWLSTDAVPARFNAVSVANGVVYASDLSGTVTARHADTGVVLAKLPLGAPAWGGVSIAGGSVFAATGTGSSTGYVVAYRPRG